MTWRFDFYAEEDGSLPLRRFLEGLPDAEFGKVAQVLELLRSYGPTLPFPWSSQVRGRLRELRCHSGRRNICVLYYCDAKRVFVLLHGVVKASPALAREDIALAEKRMSRDRRVKEEK